MPPSTVLAGNVNRMTQVPGTPATSSPCLQPGAGATSSGRAGCPRAPYLPQWCIRCAGLVTVRPAQRTGCVEDDSQRLGRVGVPAGDATSFGSITGAEHFIDCGLLGNGPATTDGSSIRVMPATDAVPE